MFILFQEKKPVLFNSFYIAMFIYGLRLLNFVKIYSNINSFVEQNLLEVMNIISAGNIEQLAVIIGVIGGIILEITYNELMNK